MDNIASFARVEGANQMIAARPGMSENEVNMTRATICFASCIFCRNGECYPSINSRAKPNSSVTDPDEHIIINTVPAPISQIADDGTGSAPFSPVPEGCRLVG